MARWVFAGLMILAVGVTGATVRQNRDLREARRVVLVEEARLELACDSLRAERRSAEDAWREDLQLARDGRGMLLEDYEIEQLQKAGLSDPVSQLQEDLRAHVDMLPFKGKVGGTMAFGRIVLLNRRWVYAEFDDGHYGGVVLFEYEVLPSGTVQWTIIKTRLF